ncbi:hypothetical protein pb186bvf_019991 [Paramecium bursaria]
MDLLYWMHFLQILLDSLLFVQVIFFYTSPLFSLVFFLKIGHFMISSKISNQKEQ